MPRMPLIGVRTSWLIVVRNRDFASLAASARSRALAASWRPQSSPRKLSFSAAIRATRASACRRARAKAAASASAKATIAPVWRHNA